MGKRRPRYWSTISGHWISTIRHSVSGFDMENNLKIKTLSWRHEVSNVFYFKKIRTQTNYDIKKCIFKKIKSWLKRNSVCLSRLEVIFSKLYWIWFLRNLHCVSFKFTTECRSNLVHAIVSIIRAEKRLNRKNQQVIQQFLF